MAINIKFDLNGNPELPTIILANRNGNKLGQLVVDADSFNIIDKFNDCSEFSFTVHKSILTQDKEEKILSGNDGYLLSIDDVPLLDDNNIPLISDESDNFCVINNINLWDKLVDFKLIWCKEWDMWFETKVELDEETETIKTVFCTQLGQSELSQILLHNIEINTEDDIARDDYKISILWDEKDPKTSILGRLLEKAPHYSIIHVDNTIKNIQRNFSFDSTSIHDAFQDISEEIGCLFVYHSNSGENGKIQRTISVYDLHQNCLNPDCKHRGEFIDKCPKCGSTDIKQGYGEDTLIFVTSDELASSGIELVTNVDEVKNCFKLEAGDDLMTATVRNCNPNGTDYIWYISDASKEDMSKELVEKLDSYDDLYKDYYDNHESKLDANLLNKYNELVEKYESYYNTKSTCLNCDYEGFFEDTCPSCGSTTILSGKKLQFIPQTINGYSLLLNAYYNTIDLGLYLKSSLMPTIEMSETTAKEQASLLTSSSLSTVAVNTDYVESISLATANSAVLSMAKIIVKPTYKVEVATSTLSNDKIWEGSFIVTNYSDENDTAESNIIRVVVNNDTETFVKQKIEKALNKEDTDDYSISGLFEKEYDDFCAELKKYALNPLKSFYDACDACINILIDQGAGSKDEKPDLYEKLYEPYYNKSSAISAEIKIREEEIAVIEGVWDKTTDEKNPELIIKGLQQIIEECRNEIQDTLDFEKYLGEELWLEFCAYRREDTYSNNNYVSDGLNNAELFKRALEFREVAENEIYKSAELQHSISTSLNNLLAIEKFKKLSESFDVGNWIRVQVDDKIFKLRLLEYEIDFGNFEEISVEFSDVTKIKNSVTDVESVIQQASSMATSYSSTQRQADKGNKAISTIDQWIEDGLNTSLVQVQNNNNEEVTMTKNGLLCRSYDDITGIYLSEQLKITHNIMAYTDDNWQTVRQAIGKHEYHVYDKNTNEFINKIGYGMNSDFVTAGIVSGSQIIGGDIYSDNYSVANRTGSYLNLRDGTFSFGGGSLRFEGGELLISSPNVVTKNEITEINESYLKTTTVYAEGLQVKAANIQDKLTASQINTTGLIAENISGTTIDGKTITGGSISIGNNFSVDENGNLTAKGSADINGTITTNNLTATGGEIAGFVIGDTAIYKGTNSLSSTTSGIYLGTDGIRQYASSDANVTISNGILSANGANISGNFIATTGEIGGWTIAPRPQSGTSYSGGIYYDYKIGTSDYRVGMKVPTSNETKPEDVSAFYVTKNPLDSSIRENIFYVQNDGKLFAKKAYIEGEIKATSGDFSDDITIGGTEITAGFLKDLYNYAVGGTGTAIRQIDASKGNIGGWSIQGSDLVAVDDGISSYRLAFYSRGRGYSVGSISNTKMFFVVIFKDNRPYAGITLDGWELIYNG